MVIAKTHSLSRLQNIQHRKNGGLRLVRDQNTINVGAMIRASEGEAGLLPCLHNAGPCCIQSML